MTIFTAKAAEFSKSEAGKKYRPSNGTEGELFQEAFCHKCKKDNFDGEGGESCRILLETFAWDVEDEDYPGEWIIATDGQPTCTAFESCES